MFEILSTQGSFLQRYGNGCKCVGTLIIIIYLIFCFFFVVIFVDISRPKTLQEIAFLTDRRPSLVKKICFPF